MSAFAIRGDDVPDRMRQYAQNRSGIVLDDTLVAELHMRKALVFTEFLAASDMTMRPCVQRLSAIASPCHRSVSMRVTR